MHVTNVEHHDRTTAAVTWIIMAGSIKDTGAHKTAFKETRVSSTGSQSKKYNKYSWSTMI